MERIMNVKRIITFILEDENDVNIIQMIRHYGLLENLILRDHRAAHIRNKNYFEITIPQYSLSDFHAHFRMGRATMELLVNIIGQNMDQREYYVIPLQKQVTLTIWILAKAESFLAVGDRFDMSPSTAHYCYKNIIRTLASLLGTYVKWPNEGNIQDIINDFQDRSHGMPRVIGAIDGCHIQIMQPHNNPTDYYNRKGFHSVILQGICDNKRRFIDIHIGVPGRVHDARVFRNSPLFQNIMYHNLIPARNHLIGDSAYPLNKFVMVPYKDNGHLTFEQIRYNRRLSSIRSTIERAFGLLKGKFRKLKYLEMYNLDLINYTIASACILHNFILMEEDNYDDIDDEEIENEEIENEDVEIMENPDEIRHLNESGHEKRNVIVHMLQ